MNKPGSMILRPIWTLPNLITCLRIAVGPACIFLILEQSSWALWCVLVLMLAAEFSDFLDGHFARAWKQQSNVGKLLDPMADSIYRVAVFMAFVALGWMPVWMLLVIVYRDVIVAAYRVMAEQRFGTMGARQSGKLKAVVQSFAQILTVGLYAIWGADLGGWVDTLAYSGLLLATAVTFYSLIDYSTGFFRQLLESNEAQ